MTILARHRRHALLRRQRQQRLDAWLERYREPLRRALYETMSPADRLHLARLTQNVQARRKLACVN